MNPRALEAGARARKRKPKPPQHDQHVKFYRNHWKSHFAMLRWKRGRANFIGLNPW